MVVASVARSKANVSFPFAAPGRSRLFAVITFELVFHPEQRAEDDGAIIAGQVHDTSLDDEAAQFDQVPRALAALNLPYAQNMPRPCCLLTVVRRQAAPERRQCGAQLPVQFAAPGSERTRFLAWLTPPSIFGLSQHD